MKLWLALASGLMIACAAGPAMAGSVTVAVAANFTATVERLAATFTARTGDELVLSLWFDRRSLRPDQPRRTV
ncbi:hypothetical protein [Devosia algicola]|uniref:hypothetical protein n=1 Tax=Devosia algicola TaxID=3026418 RepID=UPI002E1F39DB